MVPPGFTMPTMPSSVGTGAQAGTDTESSLTNPGTFEECHRKCKGSYQERRFFNQFSTGPVSAEITLNTLNPKNTLLSAE